MSTVNGNVLVEPTPWKVVISDDVGKTGAATGLFVGGTAVGGLFVGGTAVGDLLVGGTAVGGLEV